MLRTCLAKHTTIELQPQPSLIHCECCDILLSVKCPFSCWWTSKHCHVSIMFMCKCESFFVIYKSKIVEPCAVYALCAMCSVCPLCPGQCSAGRSSCCWQLMMEAGLLLPSPTRDFLRSQSRFVGNVRIIMFNFVWWLFVFDGSGDLTQASCMIGKCSATELHTPSTQIHFLFSFFFEAGSVYKLVSFDLHKYHESIHSQSCFQTDVVVEPYNPSRLERLRQGDHKYKPRLKQLGEILTVSTIKKD